MVPAPPLRLISRALRTRPPEVPLSPAMPADPVLERLAVLCLALLAAPGEVAEGEALERLAAIVGDGRG